MHEKMILRFLFFYGKINVVLKSTLHVFYFFYFSEVTMSSFIISTDSTCDLPYEFIKENDVLIQPLQYTTGDQIFHDGPTTDLKKFYDNMRSGVTYKTNASNPVDVSNSFRPFLEKGNAISFFRAFSALFLFSIRKRCDILLCSVCRKVLCT